MIVPISLLLSFVLFFLFCFLFDDNRYTGNQTEFIMRNLTMGTTHYFQIAAAVRRQSLPDLIGPFSNISSCSTSGTSCLHSLFPLLSSKIDTELTSFLYIKGLPQSPLLNLQQHGRDFLVLSWDTPNDGGSLTMKYLINVSGTFITSNSNTSANFNSSKAGYMVTRNTTSDSSNGVTWRNYTVSYESTRR